MKPLFKPSLVLALVLFLTLIDLAPAGYDPTIGRWLSRDADQNAEFLPEGPNLYSYVGNDPIRYIDRLGKDREVWDGVGRPWIYHKWISVDTWDDKGNRTGKVACHVGKHLYGPTEYSILPQRESLGWTYPQLSEKRETISSTPREDRALINQWGNWVNNGGPDYWKQGTCIGATDSMKGYRGPQFRYDVNVR